MVANPAPRVYLDEDQRSYRKSQQSIVGTELQYDCYAW